MFYICDHCGRKDLGSAAAGIAEVEVRIFDINQPGAYLGRETLYVCNPTVRYRPRCLTLVTTYAPRADGGSEVYVGHTRDCKPCRTNYPPGAEQRALPEEGKWSTHEAWILTPA